MAREHGDGRRGSHPPPLRIERHLDGTDVHVDITGEIDAASSDAFLDELQQVARSESGPIILNLAQVSFLDSSGLHALVNAREAAGARLRLGTVNPTVRRVLEMTSLLTHLQRPDDSADPG